MNTYYLLLSYEVDTDEFQCSFFRLQDAKYTKKKISTGGVMLGPRSVVEYYKYRGTWTLE